MKLPLSTLVVSLFLLIDESWARGSVTFTFCMDGASWIGQDFLELLLEHRVRFAVLRSIIFGESCTLWCSQIWTENPHANMALRWCFFLLLFFLIS